ncbi:Der GTPase-activating protein YihI [Vibrio cholerae]|nr:Der GTPase-activating protein YihI [Vibrio cholerae]
MSRSKKSRKPGTNSNDQLAVVRTRSESELESRLRKKLKKRKGLKSGSRHSEGSESQVRQAAQKRDPRLGSKKPIPLIVAEPKKLNKQERKLAAEQELAMLEKDAQLNVLLDRLDNGEKLGIGLQKYVDDKLDRIEVLMEQLGLLDDEPEPAPAPQSKPTKKRKTEDDLLSEFEQLDVDKYQD